MTDEELLRTSREHRVRIAKSIDASPNVVLMTVVDMLLGAMACGFSESPPDPEALSEAYRLAADAIDIALGKQVAP